MSSRGEALPISYYPGYNCTQPVLSSLWIYAAAVVRLRASTGSSAGEHTRSQPTSSARSAHPRAPHCSACRTASGASHAKCTFIAYARPAIPVREADMQRFRAQRLGGVSRCLSCCNRCSCQERGRGSLEGRRQPRYRRGADTAFCAGLEWPGMAA